MNSRFGALFVLSLILGSNIGFGNSPKQEQEQEQEQEQKQEQEPDKTEASESAELVAPDPFPAIDNMHHFMEYVIEPSYKNLKTALAKAPEARSDWRLIKSYALILGETSSLVANRYPDGVSEEQVKQWRTISWEVREAARALYGSMGEYELARKNYEVMIDSCNKCHDVFEDGRHQLDK